MIREKSSIIYFAYNEHKIPDLWKDTLLTEHLSNKFPEDVPLLLTDGTVSNDLVSSCSRIEESNMTMFRAALIAATAKQKTIIIDAPVLGFHRVLTMGEVESLGYDNPLTQDILDIRENQRMLARRNLGFLRAAAPDKKVLCALSNEFFLIDNVLARFDVGNTLLDSSMARGSDSVITSPEYFLYNCAYRESQKLNDGSYVSYDLNTSGARSVYEFSEDNGNIVAAIGCSNTFGNAVHMEENWPSVFERNQPQGIKNTVYNYATPAASLEECYNQLMRIVNNPMLMKGKLKGIILCLPSVHRASFFARSAANGTTDYVHFMPNWEHTDYLSVCAAYQRLQGKNSDLFNALNNGYVWLTLIGKLLDKFESRLGVKIVAFTWSSLTQDMMNHMKIQNIKPKIPLWAWPGDYAPDGIHPSAAKHSTIAKELVKAFYL